MWHSMSTGRLTGLRLDQDLKNRFCSRAYASEVLIAELGAAFLGAEFGFDGGVRHSGYIGNWVELFEGDERALFTACSQASEAADYLRVKASAEPADVAALAQLSQLDLVFSNFRCLVEAKAESLQGAGHRKSL